MASKSKYAKGLESIGVLEGEDIRALKEKLGAAVRVHQFPPLREVPQAGGWMALAAIEALVIAALVANCWYKYLTV